MRRRNGFGTLTQGPETSEGEWVSDKLHGTGGAPSRAARRMKAASRRASSVGRALITWADGASYVGGWKAGRMHGEGCYTDTDKVEWKGAFHNGSFFNGTRRATLR